MKILLADDQQLVLAGVRKILELDGGFEIAGEALHGVDIIPMVERTRPDALLLDLRMRGIDGLDWLDRLRSHCPGVKVVMFSIAADVSEIHAAFKHGASGYILKSIDPRDFASAVRQAVEKTAYHAIDLPAINAALAASTSGLSDRELQVLTAAARGLSNKAIAGEFSITEQTVKFHLTNIYRKLGISNRTEAGVWAVDEGLLGTMDSLPSAV